MFDHAPDKLRILIAPDAFKGTLRATEAAVAIESGLRSTGLPIEVRKLPLADGGEGSLDAMLAAGLHQVFFGIESGDAESLRRICKKMPLDTIRDAVAMTRSKGVRTSGFFMVGFPWQDEPVMQQTADFATSLDLDAVSLFSATPLPGTELWDMSPTDALPDSIDFRAPQVNLTTLAPAEYAAVYGRIKGQIDAYNQAQMMARLPVQRDWMQLP